MLDVEWSVEEVAEVALVEVSVHNPTAVDRRCRVENRVDGPTLPPRTGGVPERGWDADGYAGVVSAGETLRLGYASPAPPTEPPVTVEDRGRAADDGGTDDADAAAAVRLLDDASPPADALPASAASVDRTGPGDRAPENGAATDADVSACVPSDDEGVSGDVPDRGDDTGPEPAVSPDAPARNGDGERPRTNGVAEAPQRAVGSATGGEGDGDIPGNTDRTPADPATCPGGGDDAGDVGSEPAGEPDGDLPQPVAAWLADVEGRVGDAERLTGASVVEAAAVLDERGGLPGVEPLPARLADDRAALRALAERAAALADRAAATDVPVAALRRLS